MSAPLEPLKTPEQGKAAPKLARPHNLNPGSAGASEHLASCTVARIAPYHAHDLSKIQTCGFENLLIHLLCKIQTSKPENPGRQLLDELLTLVLPLANGTNEKASPEAYAMKEELERYCKTQAQKDRYAPFAGAVNHALKALKSLKTPSTEVAPAHTGGDGHDALWFQVSDPTLILGPMDLNCTSLNLKNGGMFMSSWELKKEKDTIVLPPDFRKGEYTIQQNTKSTISPRQGVLKEANEHIDARGRGEKFEPMSESNHEGSGSRHVRTGKNTAFAQSPEGRTSARLQKAGGKRPAEDYPKPHAEVQVVMHAAESMNAQIGRAQVLNFIIRYSRLWIWYFDRESPIQSSGFDILEDLPYFLALLFILQRFDKKDWGFIPELSTDEIRLGGRTSNVFHRNREESMTAHHGLSGRYPQVLYGTFQQRHAAFKPTHAEVIRTSEVDILNKAHKLLEGVPNMQACLPELLDFKDFDDFNTSHIRQALGIKADGDKPSHRVPRAIIFVFYLPLVSLTTDMEIFRAAFVRLICCHAILWLHGIEHGDISVANVMCSEDGTPKLCDYDLSNLREARPVGFTNTGTLRFMASELLTDDAMAGKVKRVYRHDADAFSWVLLWVLGRYRGGKLLELEEGRLFDPWATQITFAEIYQKRSTAYTSIMNQEAVFPQPLSDNFRRDALRFIVYLRTARLDRESAVAKLVFQEDSHLGQKLQKELAILDSPTFVQSVLNTTLIADSKYSGLVKVALEAYMPNELIGR